MNFDLLPTAVKLSKFHALGWRRGEIVGQTGSLTYDARESFEYILFDEFWLSTHASLSIS